MYQLRQIPSEAEIKKYFRKILFGYNVYCPECKSSSVLRYEDRFRCRRCKIKFTLVSHTWLKGMKISFQKFWLILWCWTTQIPVRQAMALCGLSEEAVRRWYDRFRSNLPQQFEILERIVQLDEAYFKKISLMMAKQSGTRKIAFELFNTSSVQRDHALYFLGQYVKPKSKLKTDGAIIYKDIEEWWPVSHEQDIHDRFEFSNTSEIEGMFGNLRTFIRRMYHHTTPEKMPEIVREFCFRFSSPEIFDNPHEYLERALTLVPFG
ncbi:MAG: transposase [Candidatus Moraniibacteriota bacterium]